MFIVCIGKYIKMVLLSFRNVKIKIFFLKYIFNGVVEGKMFGGREEMGEKF